jgi:hypothetical protein
MPWSHQHLWRKVVTVRLQPSRHRQLRQNVTRVGAVQALVAALTVGAIALTGATAAAVAPIPVPASIPSNCSVDNAPALSNWLNSLPANSMVNFPANGCFLINSTLWVHNTTGLTINGNNTLLVQSVAPAVPAPFIFLTQDTNLAMSNAVVIGAYNGTNGGAGQEGNYGFLLEADHCVYLTHLNVNNIQGDFINLNAPNTGDTGSDTSLNSNVSVTNSTFTNAGYHGITVEAANGATFNRDTFTNVGTDAIDFEYDNYSTVFVNGQPTEAAEDNISITNNTFTNFTGDWFASIQGQLPGVQQQNVNLSYNTIDGGSGLIEITGTDPTTTTAQYENKGLISFDNHSVHANVGTTGASIADPPGGSAAMQIQNVVNGTIVGNTMPLFDGMPGYFANTPYIAVLQAYGMQNLLLKGNDFTGASSILQPGSGNNTMTECGNKYGVNGAQTDGVCSCLLPQP